MVDLKSLQMELAFARRARREAEIAGLDIERLVSRMQAGRTLQQIELEEAAMTDGPEPVYGAEFVPAAIEFRQAA